MGGGSALAQAADAAAVGLVESLAGASASSAVSGTVGEWAAALVGLQRVVDVATAAQEVAICRLAAIEVDHAEDGTVVERHRALGQVSLDAAPVVSGALGCTSGHAEQRVRSAVARAADGPAGSPAETGLGGLHTAMAAGRLDRYRADVVAAELDGAPPPVAASVVAALDPYFATETGPQLRRRCRRLLVRVSPDLLRQRSRLARSGSRLERWAGEPGVDTWHGTFPSEEAALAWAAVDALAQRYLADGTCPGIDRARAKALTDLVTGNATITTDIVLTVPAATLTPTTGTETGESGLAAAAATGSTGPVAAANGSRTPVPGRPSPVSAAGEHQSEAADRSGVEAATTPAGSEAPVVAGTGSGAATVPDGNTAAAVTVRDRDDTAAVPDGNDTAAAPPPQAPAGDPVAAEVTVPDPPPHPEDLVEVPGLRPSEPLLVPRGWLTGLTRDTAAAAAGDGPRSSRGRRRRAARVRSCHPDTGALLADHPPDQDRTQPPPGDPTGLSYPGRSGGPGDGRGPSDPGPSGPSGYRPSRELAALVRARDGHCRFPGCHVSARFCDLDHVRPWPAGPTTAANLACLCRRHHRTKQRPGWQVRIHPDATLTWTDPTGRTRTTTPQDALHPLVLPHRDGEPDHVPHTPMLALPDGPHSALEFALEHHLAARTTHAAPASHAGRAGPAPPTAPEAPPF